MSALADTSKLLDSFTFMKANKGESIHKTYFGMAPIGQVCCTVNGIKLHIVYGAILFLKINERTNSSFVLFCC